MNTGDLNTALKACTDDMRSSVSVGSIDLDVQVRAYDLLSDILEAKEYGRFPDMDFVCGYCTVYESVADKLKFDEAALKEAAAARLTQLKEAENEARFEAAAAAGLHEFAKETFETWKTGGIFMRRRALRDLRERAGFKLESHRIGNYVAKTYDLMNEAYARFARAQQAVFASDVSYKCRPGIHQAIYDVLKTGL